MTAGARAHAWEEGAKYHGKAKYSVGDQQQVFDRLTEAQISNADILSDCHCSLPFLPVDENPSCRKDYAKLFDKPVVNMKIILGYFDIPPQQYSIDRIFRAALKRKILEKPCPPNSYLCEFKPVDDDGEKFQKVIRGPDGRSRTVVITLVTSSYTTSRALNEKYADEQEAQSEHAEEELLGFKDTSLTMFIGHARTRCGLGTYIPPLRPLPDGTPTVDYREECKRGTMAKIANALAQHQPKMFSQIACRSNPGMDKLLAKYPNMATQRTKKFSWPEDWPYEVYGTLNGLLGQVCEPTLSRMINPPITDPSGRLKFSGFQSF